MRRRYLQQVGQVLGLSLVLALAACGDDDPESTNNGNNTNNQSDMGVMDDSGNTEDTGTIEDTGTPDDVGMGEDTGTPADASTPDDAGNNPDAGGGSFDNPQSCWEADYSSDFYQFVDGNTIVKLGPDGTEISSAQAVGIDGGDPTGLANPRIAGTVDIDEAAGQLYWIRSGSAQAHAYSIGLDGTGLNRLTPNQFDRQKWLQHVPENGMLYILGRSDALLTTLQSDGTGSEATLSLQESPFEDGWQYRVNGFHVDHANSLIYWAVSAQDRPNRTTPNPVIGTTDLDGNSWTLIDDESIEITAMNVSPEDNLIVFFGRRELLKFDVTLFTMELDGSNLQEFEIPETFGITSTAAINPDILESEDRIFWFKDGSTYSIKYDGTGFTACADTQLFFAD